MVSLLVPVYNTAPYLRQCVESLTSQTYTDLQIVLINDGSTDGSLDIMKELAMRDKRIEVYSQPNRGVAATRNQLLDKARGEFVLFVDSDDWIEVDAVETLLREQQHEDYDIVNYQIVGMAGQKRVLSTEETINLFLEHKVLKGQLWNKLIKRKLLDGLSFDELVWYGEDALFIWYALTHLNKMIVVENQLYHHRRHSDSISRQNFNGKKFTAYTVWSEICDDVDVRWPQYSEIAHARFACEMSLILFSAAEYRYKYDSSVRLLQEEIKKDYSVFVRALMPSFSMSMFAKLVSQHYWICRLFGFFLKYYDIHFLRLQ